MDYKVLIIEDEPQIREIVGKYLQNAGYEVYSADNGIDGLAVFAERQPHLVILDVMMPGISGLDVLKIISADESLKSIKVIILSATAKYKEPAAQLGYKHYLVKPFKITEIIEKINELLCL